MERLIPTGCSRRDTNLAGKNSITDPAHKEMRDVIISLCHIFFLSTNCVLETQRM